MVRKRKQLSAEERVLTEAELIIMRSLWHIGEGSVPAVQASIENGQDLAYTTISTILRILEEKEFVRARAEGRSHIYTPAISRAAYEQRAVRHLVTRLFKDNPLSVVKHLIDFKEISPDEIGALRQMIDRLDSEVSEKT